LKSLHDAFDRAADYHKAREAGDPEDPTVDARWKALLPVLAGEMPIIVHANSATEIQAAVAFAAARSLKLIIYGGADAPYCAALLKQHDVPVIVGSVYRLPRRRSDAFDDAYTLPARLHQAGVAFCIAGVDRFGASNLRNLPYHAATAVAYGLPEDEAIKALTLYPAQILGVASRVGSLEVGKDATLIVTTGSPLETPSQVERAFIQGRVVDLNSRHTQLWKKYQVKYQRIKAAEGN
jgi:imidazolonepropionase-like amidohydrolase